MRRLFRLPITELKDDVSARVSVGAVTVLFAPTKIKFCRSLEAGDSSAKYRE